MTSHRWPGSWPLRQGQKWSASQRSCRSRHERYNPVGNSPLAQPHRSGEELPVACRATSHSVVAKQSTCAADVIVIESVVPPPSVPLELPPPPHAPAQNAANASAITVRIRPGIHAASHERLNNKPLRHAQKKRNIRWVNRSTAPSSFGSNLGGVSIQYDVQVADPLPSRYRDGIGLRRVVAN